MKSFYWIQLVALLTTSMVAHALPQQIGATGITGGGDATPHFLNEEVWSHGKLPGDWKQDSKTKLRTVKRLDKLPFIFGQVPQEVVATEIEGKLEEITITYLEAGHFYGYQSEANQTEEGRKQLKKQAREFRKIFRKLEKELPKAIGAATTSAGKVTKAGRTELLRTHFQDYWTNGLSVRFQAIPDKLVRVSISPRARTATSAAILDLHMDSTVKGLRKSEKRRFFQANVTKAAGDVKIEGVPMLKQGKRAYCGISTFAMITQYFGLKLDAADFAAKAGFRHGLGGKKTIEVYNAAAKEADLRLSRSHQFEFERAVELIEKGYPVLVWRKFSEERDRLHTRHTESLARGRDSVLPEPDEADQARWAPAKSNLPNHASVITGFNKDRGEVIFTEAWGEHTRDRRMRAEEMAGSSYMAFYFKI